MSEGFYNFENFERIYFLSYHSKVSEIWKEIVIQNAILQFHNSQKQKTGHDSPVHLDQDLESLHLILLLWFFQKCKQKLQVVVWFCRT